MSLTINVSKISASKVFTEDMAVSYLNKNREVYEQELQNLALNIQNHLIKLGLDDVTFSLCTDNLFNSSYENFYLSSPSLRTKDKSIIDLNALAKTMNKEQNESLREFQRLKDFLSNPFHLRYLPRSLWMTVTTSSLSVIEI